MAKAKGCSGYPADRMTASMPAASGLTGLPGPILDVACIAGRHCSTGPAGSAWHLVHSTLVLLPKRAISFGTAKYDAGGKVYSVLPSILAQAGSIGNRAVQAVPKH